MKTLKIIAVMAIVALSTIAVKEVTGNDKPACCAESSSCCTPGSSCCK